MVMNTKHHHENWLEGSGGVSDLNTNSNEWTELWHIKVPSKLKVFLWRLAQHSIPYMDILHCRNMSTTRRCALCGCDDSWRHALLECTMSRCI
uniref:Reverse transcriptase zinc-binding domain-containing protein n=1 Tax=Triticum urartu TaxID=4572 RepID=A0A8R7PGX9_TRIUA